MIQYPRYAGQDKGVQMPLSYTVWNAEGQPSSLSFLSITQYARFGMTSGQGILDLMVRMFQQLSFKVKVF